MTNHFLSPRSFARAAILAFLCLVSSATEAITSPVGSTPGSFAVSPSGAASYTIPIAVPPGTAGMEPKLALTYNSQGGNGLLGMGWSLSGLSAIHRCAATIAQDGFRGGINYNKYDRYCLDGKRLVRTDGYSEPKPGAGSGLVTHAGVIFGTYITEYSLETDPSIRVVATAYDSLRIPAHFSVYTKSGQIMEFGVTPDSRIEAQGKSSVSVWALNKVQDTVGNYLTVTYLEDNANGQYYPTRVDYTGNSSKGLLATNSVRFAYETRTDISNEYTRGALVKQTVRLVSVEAFAGAASVRRYTLSYDPRPSILRSRILSIAECAELDCLPPHTFAWSAGSGGSFNSPGWWATQWCDPKHLDLGDFNGDGKTDMICNSDAGWHLIAFSNGDGTFSSAPSAWPSSGAWCDPLHVKYGDFNGDGKLDMICSSDVGWHLIAFSNGDGTFSSAPSAWPSTGAWCTPARLDMADYNGDGRTDLRCYRSEDQSQLIALSTGDGFFTVPSAWWRGYDGAWCIPQHAKGDFNGDGKTDLLCSSGYGKYIAYLSAGDGTFSTPGWWAPQLCDLLNLDMGDYNGDGKTDLRCPNPADGKHQIAFSTGDGFFTTPSTGWPSTGAWCDPAHTKQGDYNGDGKTDLRCHNPADGRHLIALSTGDGSFTTPSTWWPSYGAWCDPEHTKQGDFNGDGMTDLICNAEDGKHIVAFSSSTADVLTTINNGQATASIAYKPITDNTVYFKENSSTYPTLDLQTPIYVVSSTSIDNGIGGTRTTNYSYGGAKADLSGRGLLGFRWMQATDQDTGMRSYTAYSQTYPYIGMPIQIQRSVNGVVLNDSAATLAAIPLGGQRYFPYVARNVEQSFETNGAFISSATTDSVYDSFGNPTQISVTSNDGYVKTVTSTYDNDTTSWILGRLRTAQVKSTMPNASFAVRNSSFAYNPTNGLLTQEVIEPGTVFALTTAYGYDGFGNKTTATVSGPGIVSRMTTTTYDGQGRFPIKTTNALGHSETRTFDARFGKPATLTGPNSLTTTWSYDGFGRKVNETRADGTQTNVAFKLCDASCPSRAKFYVSLAKYYVVTTSAGSPTSYAYFDILNREIRAQVQGFDGRLITKDTFYDSLGRVDRVTKPYYAGDSVLYSRYQYEALGRVIQETAPDNSTRKVAYNGLITTATNALSQTEIKTKNSQGQLVSVRDNLGNLISYQYDPFSNLTKTTDPKGNVISLTYDLRGRKIGMVDPDMGTWTYTYNVLGQLTQQKDAKLQAVNMSYDLLGRMLTRSEPDLNSTWVYDTAVKGIGKLKQVSSDNGFLRVYAYDSLGRAATETSTIDAAYTVAKSYDAYGRVSVLTYPTGVAIKNIYNAYGYLSEVRNNANLALFWKANAKDAEGHVLNETLGNGLTTTRTYTDTTTGRVQTIATSGASAVQNQTFTFDFLGNLKARTDSVAGVNESFGYDGLNRLTSASQGAVTTTVAYDSIGNISNKSDAGAYTYGAKPHAVTQVAGALNASYGYDANGNLISGAGREVSYTSYNLPSQMAGANGGAFLYDADHTRITQYSSATTIYLNPRIDTGMHFEKEIKNGVTENKHYLYGAAGVVGVYTTRGTGPDTLRSTSYFHQDHLGSIVAVTNDSAVVIARYAFDPWGKRLTLAGDPQATHHGFTGHEHLDEMGLIHMNGRVYDPLLGRFMSADPEVQFPETTQGFNRYSYVDNNPLSFTDPSGNYLDTSGGGSSGDFSSGNWSDSWNSDSWLKDDYYWLDPGPLYLNSPITGPNSYVYILPGGPNSSSPVVNNTFDNGILGLNWGSSLPNLSNSYDSYGSSQSSWSNSAPSFGANPFAGSFGPGTNVAMGPLLALGLRTLGIGLMATEVATGDVPILGGSSVKVGAKIADGVADVAKGEATFFRGAKPGELPSFTPRPSEFKITPQTGTVAPTHGVSVFNNELSVTSKGFEAYRVDLGSVPDSLQIIQRGKDLSHFEITPAPGANLTLEQFYKALSCITCK